ncbi:hypothetical protein [Allobranchiibius huperziae]|uniref:Uncharacterized membrane protein HdeD (DUF308 family) n=1 Tax=Allobranchiibius huperziae TaxID=1874116 RepID=A0A853DG18_9MICO|nr:hypothetical protein [Allobranchiibius huperziae]NYJ74004.1 uncharacterized membrane protein HdeD (DUF308 family) [Allobranchiibius huperziae]
MSSNDRESAPPRLSTGWRRVLPAALLALQGVVLLVLGVLLIIRTITGHESNAGRSLTLAIVVLVFALGAALIARALLRGEEGARSPTLVWGVFVVLIGVTLARGGAPVVGVVVTVLGAGTLAAGWTAAGGRPG